MMFIKTETTEESDSYISLSAIGRVRIFSERNTAQRKTMMILALLTLLLITNGSAVGQMANVTGFVGQNVVLPCGCSNESNLVWQKSERVVNAYPQDETISIDQDYMKRTELFLEKEKTNCSLNILKITLADAGVYTCHDLVNVKDKVWSMKSSEVNLTVSENLEATVSHLDDKPNPVSISVPILVMLILAVAALLTLMIKRRHRTNTETDLRAQQPMIENV